MWENLSLIFTSLKILLYVASVIGALMIWSFLVYLTSKFWYSAKEEQKKQSFLKMSKEILSEKEKDSAKRTEKQ